MDIKKYPKYDIEQKRGIFFRIGIIFSLLVVLVGFQWKCNNDNNTFDGLQVMASSNYYADEEMPTVNQYTPEVPLPEITLKPKTDLIEIVENKTTETSTSVNNDNISNTPGDKTGIGKEGEIFIRVQEPPSFPGGEAARVKYLQTNVRYPYIARSYKIKGTVYISFVIETDGSVSNIKIIRGIGGGCDEEAARVVNIMPRWTPGRQHGKPVRVQIVMPLTFTFQG